MFLLETLGGLTPDLLAGRGANQKIAPEVGVTQGSLQYGGALHICHFVTIGAFHGPDRKYLATPGLHGSASEPPSS